MKDEAVQYVRSQLTTLVEGAQQAIEGEKTRSFSDLIALINFVEKRMGSLKLFEQEIKELAELRSEMEGIS